MNLETLREEVKELVGPGAYSRLYKDEWTDDGINWGCEQIAVLMGLTRTDALGTVNNKQVIIPEDAIKVVEVIVR